MIRLAADENLDHAIVRGLKRRYPGVVQDVGLQAADDPTILAWTADEGRLLVTHDVKTMPRYASERVKAGQRMPGVVLVPTSLPIGVAIQEIALLATGSGADEWEGQVIRLPL
ncbi:DUF5615 family PIN-like protein [Planctomycetota bacterium]